MTSHHIGLRHKYTIIWWNKNGFGEETWLAYNPELAVTDEVIDPVANVVGDELGG